MLIVFILGHAGRAFPRVRETNSLADQTGPGPSAEKRFFAAGWLLPWGALEESTVNNHMSAPDTVR
jgi:hypothetical protein